MNDYKLIKTNVQKRNTKRNNKTEDKQIHLEENENEKKLTDFDSESKKKTNYQEKIEQLSLKSNDIEKKKEPNENLDYKFMLFLSSENSTESKCNLLSQSTKNETSKVDKDNHFSNVESSVSFISNLLNESTLKNMKKHGSSVRQFDNKSLRSQLQYNEKIKEVDRSFSKNDFIDGSMNTKADDSNQSLNEKTERLETDNFLLNNSRSSFFRLLSKLNSDAYYNSTKYRYASKKKTVDFLNIFKSSNLNERLLDDFSCALSREILFQGKLYVSEYHICFNSNLLGWVNSIVIPIDNVINIEKRSTAGLFPNGIIIETTDTKHYFASFLSRDTTYELIKVVWTQNKKKKNDNSTNQLKMYFSDNYFDCNSDNINYFLDSTQNITNIIENPSKKIDSDYEEKTNAELDLKKKEINPNILRFRAGSGYKNHKPEFSSPTKLKMDFENDEITVFNETIEAPLVVVFELMFSSSNTSFHRMFLEKNKSYDISDYGTFHSINSDGSVLVRNYTYKKMLSLSLGPKFTRCDVTELVEHMDFHDYVVVSIQTKTPDVPSGNSFFVITKYYFTWAENNHTRITIKSCLKWMGKSWLKGIIEKQTFIGQKNAFELLKTLLDEEIKNSVYKNEITNLIDNTVNDNFVTETALNSTEIIDDEIKPNVQSMNLTSKSNNHFFYLIIFFFSIFLLLQLKILTVINNIDMLIHKRFESNIKILDEINENIR